MHRSGERRAIPTIEDQLRAATARLMSILRRYLLGERTAQSSTLMALEIELVVGYLLELDLPDGVAQDYVLAPVADYLMVRHGPEAGARLNAEFVAAFEAVGMSLLVPTARVAARPGDAAVGIGDQRRG